MEGPAMMGNPFELKHFLRHFCACYASEEDRDHLAQSFIREGLLRDEQVLWIVPDPDRLGERVAKAWLRDGIFLKRKGQLTFHRSESIYFPGGAFDSDRVLSLLVSCVQSALELGFTGVRVVSDASWILEHPFGAHHVVDYENRVNKVAMGMPCSLLCLYPGQALPRAFLAYVLLCHPYILKKDGCYYNPSYEEFDVLMEAPLQAATYNDLLERLTPVVM